MPKALATPPAGASIPLIDLRVIANIRALDDGADEFLPEIVAMFRAESPARLAQIRRAASARDCRRLVSVAHALKGSARTLGLFRLAEACQQVESLARVGGDPDGDTLQCLDREYAAATAALAGLRGNDGR